MPEMKVRSTFSSFAGDATKAYRQPWTANLELLLMAVITTNRTPVNSQDERFFEARGAALPPGFSSRSTTSVIIPKRSKPS